MATRGAWSRSPWTFFALVFVLAAPFVLLGEFSGVRLPANLPLSALQFVVPLVAAAILVGINDGAGEVRRLLRAAVDVSSIRRRIWYAPILLIMPAVTLASYWLMRLAGQPLPEPRISWTAVLIYCVIYFIAGVAEEVGWTGYATSPMQQRWGALGGGAIVGTVWAAWHLVPYLQLHEPAWAFWQCAFTVAARVIIVWLHNNTGHSVFAAVLFHMTMNVTYSASEDGWSYDPAFAAPVMLVAAALVVALWGPKTLARYRFSSR
ncbi:hypothetical protein SAMN05216215_103383 [Saccharopolyspora shandongensis]|uniref:CAAX prenyl protease 2/Lysostaphin resistance protein A-like domain-containing protein n=1 Tax=Saccharopolyspora shandongensis TaxID=418495 RepID=A0A1H3M8V3_9PSEU|nr:type II CAAX endopeptidase family protein [Saccharopolyspora shandongensis]SDY72455.1 hypothetical protein SAMN05216215_103383 [Saccharopolyspora shandongensis]